MTDLVAQLPRVLADDGFVSGLLRIVEDVSATVEVQVAGIDTLVDLSVTTEDMVVWMAGWLGLDWVAAELPEPRRRSFVQGAGALLAWRGTRKGLQGLLELVTDAPVAVRDSGGVFGAGQAPVGAPWMAVDMTSVEPLTVSQVAAVALAHAPIGVAFGLTVGGLPVPWEPPGGDAPPPPLPPDAQLVR